jgi:hypothetical protein
MEVGGMAQAGGRRPEREEPRQHDGVLRCRLCIHHTPGEECDWCPAIDSVICDDCCRQLMLGQMQLLVAASDAAGEALDPTEIVAECTDCPRLVRLISERVLDDREPDERLH